MFDMKSSKWLNMFWIVNMTLIFQITIISYYFLEQDFIQKHTILNLPDVHTYNYQLLLSPRNVCQRKDRNISVLVIVCSSTDHADERLAIRRTWASEASRLGIAVYFILGVSSNGINERIKNESKTFGDVIQYNFEDTYNNLTIKSVHLLKWAKDHCIQSKYVIKVDDDVYLNLENFIYYINSIINMDEADIFGEICPPRKPTRDYESKHFVPYEEYPFPRIPAFVAGFAYFFPRNKVSTLYKSCIRLPFYRTEDAFVTGICRLKATLKLHNVKKFVRKGRKDYCSFAKNIATHRTNISNMYSVWEHIPNCTLSKI